MSENFDELYHHPYIPTAAMPEEILDGKNLSIKFVLYLRSYGIDQIFLATLIVMYVHYT